ncbi:MAG: fumarylacetoacetate hydrolase family protein [candidate division WS1 bacterium]|nr:fumarylacetoacetate hydrolase family protein [candidate division WS1 bacterium]
MRIARFLAAGQVHYGIVEGDHLAAISGRPWEGLTVTGETFPLAEVRLLAPVEPPDVFAIGLNYKSHAAESAMELPKAPVIFLKAASSVTGPEEPVVLPAMAPDEVDYEAELAIVIGRPCRKVTEAEALDYVLGYTCGNDVSARDCQLKLDTQWARGKSFETFCPLGPWIETDLDPENAEISLKLNGEEMQHSNTQHMIFPCRYLVSYLSQVTTLRPGSVIMTGTPEGVGFSRKPQVFLRSGDRMEVSIQGIGTLANPVSAEQ